MPNIVTAAEMRAMKFSKWDQREREKLWEQYTRFNEAVAEAICILGKDKDELVEAMEDDSEYNRLGPWLWRFLKIREDEFGKGLTEIIECAELRLAVALHVVEDEEEE